MLRSTLVLTLLLSSLSVAYADDPKPTTPEKVVADAETGEEATGSFRIESEWKLRVPRDAMEPLRTWLGKRFGTGEGSILTELGPGFSARISDEAFTDDYFDTPELQLLAAESGIRHRTRHNLLDPQADRKEGRQLVQMKLRRPNDELLNRTEIKFEVEHPGDDNLPEFAVEPARNAKTELDASPLIGLVEADQREEFAQAVAKHGFDAHRMNQTISLEQRRWRVYVSRDEVPFATLTLDEVSSSFGLWKAAFVELEIELNEIAYTAASPTDRKRMEALNTRIANDVLTTFPTIKQDQTPKYNKVFNAFAAQIPGFRMLLVQRKRLLLIGLSGLVLLVAGGFGGWKWKRRTRRAPTSTASLNARVSARPARS